MKNFKMIGQQKGNEFYGALYVDGKQCSDFGFWEGGEDEALDTAIKAYKLGWL